VKVLNHNSHINLARMAGLLLIVLCVLFQRRELLHWTELAFLLTSIGLQELAIRAPHLKRIRTPMIVLYSSLPLLLVLARLDVIQAHSGDAVSLALYTPLPLVLVSVQIMVLYVRESARLTPVVLVLALFSSVIGVRRPTDDVLWPWLLLIGVVGAVFLALQYPVLLRYGLYARRGIRYGTSTPGVKRSYLAGVPVLGLTVAVLALVLFLVLPRVNFEGGGSRDTIMYDDDGTIQPYLPGNQQGPGGQNGRNGGEPRDRPDSVSGLGDGTDLGDFGEILLNDAEALQVRAVYPVSQAPQNLYLRAFTYGEFDGQRWHRLSSRSNRVLRVAGDTTRRLPEAPVYPGPNWEDRRYSIEIGRTGLGEGGVLPVPVEAQTLYGYDGVLYYDAIQNTVTGVDLQIRSSVFVDVRELRMTDGALARWLRGSRPSTAAIPDEYWHLPDGLAETIEERFEYYDRLREMVWGDPDADVPQSPIGVYGAARWITAMFESARIRDDSESYAWEYSLDRRPAAGPDSIARFLDTSNVGSERFGHCEYFASAMVVLLRCLGVPARLAVGFLAKTPNEDGVWQVKAKDAHAWVEVYFDQTGWLTFDPTPSRGLDPTDDDEQPTDTDDPDEGADPDSETNEQDADMPEADDPDEAEPTPTTVTWIDRYNRDSQSEMFGMLGERAKYVFTQLDSAFLAATGFLPPFLPRSGWLRAGLIVSLPMLLLILLFRRKTRRRHLKEQLLGATGTDEARRERGLYFQLLLLLSKYGHRKRPSETPREFAIRVLKRGGEVHLPVLVLTDTYYSLRYGHNRESERGFKKLLAEYAAALRHAEKRKSDA
jgi:hypothetical protein